MKNKFKIELLALVGAVLMMMTSCHKNDPVVDTPVVGHWGCEKYISHRTDNVDLDKWDTIFYEVGPGCAYEIFFYNTGEGLLKLNDSPAFIKEFSCDYQYDSVARTIVVESSSWLYGLYGTLFLEDDKASFNVEVLTDSTLVASWTNRVSEPLPFFERFFLKRID